MLELQQLHEAFNAFKVINEQALGEIKKYGKASGDLEFKMSGINTRMDELEAMLRRRSGFGHDNGPSPEKKLFFDALRGKANLPELQSKGLTLQGDAGYLAPSEYVNEILKGIVEWSPIRELARKRQTSRQNVLIPRKLTSGSAAWVQETGTRSESTNPTHGMEDIRPYEMYGMIKVSKQELEDSAFDIESYIREDLAEQFGVLEGTSFVSGNSVGKPEGILTNTDVSYTANGTTTLSADGLIALYYDVKEGYANRGTWVMNRKTLKAVRTLKDGTTGVYLWQPGLVSGDPPTILGRPYVSAPDMPDSAENAFPVVFGDWSRGYIVVDRIDIEVLVDPFSSKSTGCVEFTARRRVGGQVVVPEAIRKLKIAAS